MRTIARALMTNPRLILMHEPSEGLAPIIVEAIGQSIHQLKQRNYSILLVGQNISMALELADFVYIINKGEIVHKSDPDALCGNEEIMNKYLGVE